MRDGSGQGGENKAYRSCASTATDPRRCTTRIPELTRPNMVCLLSRYGVGPSVMKNWDPVRGSTDIVIYPQLRKD
jgi:hypothetical protein